MGGGYNEFNQETGSIKIFRGFQARTAGLKLTGRCAGCARGNQRRFESAPGFVFTRQGSKKHSAHTVAALILKELENQGLSCSVLGVLLEGL